MSPELTHAPPTDTGPTRDPSTWASPRQRTDESAATVVEGVLWLDSNISAVRTARVAIVDQLLDWGVDGDAVDDAALLTAELVGNVVAHSGSRGVTLSATPDRIAVAVREQRPRELSRPDELIPDDVAVPAPTTAIRGRGMKLLDALAAEWGVSRAHRTSSTWFTVAPAHRLPLAAVDPASAAAAAELTAALRRSELLLEITVALSAASGPDAVSMAITERLRRHTGAEFVGIALLDDPPRSMRYVSLSPLPAATAQEWTAFAHDGRSPVSAAARHRSTFVHPDRASAEHQFPGIAAHMDTAGVHAMAHLPMLVGGECIGSVSVCWSAPREVPGPDLELLRVVAGFAAQALRLHPTAAEGRS